MHLRRNQLIATDSSPSPRRASFAPDDWPAARPRGQRPFAGKRPADQWDAKSVVWKTALPGRTGQSSPVVLGERIFLTAALDKGKKRVVLCVDRQKGTILWQERSLVRLTREASHDMNGWATATCATDGERVVAFFGKGGLHCYSVDGKKLWSRDLGAFPGPWGTSACPIIVGDLVIQNCDATGKRLVTRRQEHGQGRLENCRAPICPSGGWSTPVLVDAGAQGSRPQRRDGGHRL